jgi:hypothetical protein
MKFEYFWLLLILVMAESKVTLGKKKSGKTTTTGVTTTGPGSQF